MDDDAPALEELEPEEAATAVAGGARGEGEGEERTGEGEKPADEGEPKSPRVLSVAEPTKLAACCSALDCFFACA